jgi:hypothetical protein
VTKKQRSAEENMKQNATTGVIKDVMKMRMNTPWPVLNPAYKEFQRLPELSLVKGFEELSLRSRQAPALPDLVDVSKMRQHAENSGRIFASSA